MLEVDVPGCGSVNTMIQWRTITGLGTHRLRMKCNALPSMVWYAAALTRLGQRLRHRVPSPLMAHQTITPMDDMVMHVNRQSQSQSQTFTACGRRDDVLRPKLVTGSSPHFHLATWSDSKYLLVREAHLGPVQVSRKLLGELQTLEARVALGGYGWYWVWHTLNR